ncbi:FUN34 transmembrane protein [Crepidotus variabilis]|uniref:FUN34 transmembrane protein n=1 Tax=Crepidotus variabilis TaxID=179855 RepID=A0A9P6EKB2_9AGAR|nr:FUN34 transmembrane protein [Crepidotus variabilis]
MASTDLEKGSIRASSPVGRRNHHHDEPIGNGPSLAPAVRPTRIGNPGTLGLFSFASTTLILSLFNLQTRSITHPNAVVGMAIFCGGLAQLLAGMWEFPRGNVFGGTAFTSYGAFWMSYATILIPGSGIGAAYAVADEFHSALGIYLITWGLVTFFFLVGALGKNWGFISLLTCLTVTFFLLAGSEFTGNATTGKAGGGVGVVTALIAYYVGLAELLAAEDQPVIRLPIGIITRKSKQL